jgi:uncharacterized protein (UPF0261 family)
MQKEVFNLKTVAIIGTFDSKGNEYSYIREIIKKLGLSTLTIHCGTFDPSFKPDVSNTEVAAAAGAKITEIVAKKDRALATEIMSKGAEALVPRLYAQGKFDGIISLGGSGGASIATPAMRALPIGVPKIMVTTMASGDTSQYVGVSDVNMFPSIVDVSGINSVSARIFANAAHAIAGMVKFNEPISFEKPVIAATMFGVTTPCIDYARKYLENQGYEVLVFHATGTGGKTMESLIEGGYIDGVLDITTTELCDELVGGVLSAGPHRLEAAGKHHVPQVVSVGALDMVNFGPPETVPQKFKGRNFYQHNPTVTLMRTSIQENKRLAEIIAEKLNRAESPTALILPLKGISMIDANGQAFYGEKEDKMLFNTISQKIDHNKIELIDRNNHINDKEFAICACDKLIELMKIGKQAKK